MCTLREANMNSSRLYATLLISILLLASCKDKIAKITSNTESSVTKTTTSITTDEWLGKWNGPEGTFIEISGGNGSY